jgi:hypothetical protein
MLYFDWHDRLAARASRLCNYGAEGGMGAAGRSDAARSGRSRTGSIGGGGTRTRSYEATRTVNRIKDNPNAGTTTTAMHAADDRLGLARSRPTGSAGGGDTNPFDAKPKGGTYVSDEYTPGAVPNFPEADLPTVLDRIVVPAMPVLGPINTLYQGQKLLAGTDHPERGLVGDAFDADAGEQDGWAPDRNHGVPNAVGGAQGTIPGRAYGAGTLALTDENAGSSDDGVTSDYSDVVLRDRRKPYGAATRMLLGL